MFMSADALMTSITSLKWPTPLKLKEHARRSQANKRATLNVEVIQFVFIS